MVLSTITSSSELNKIRCSGKRFVLFFWADWHEQSAIGGQMHSIFNALSEKHTEVDFYTIEAEAVPEISESLTVTVVPTFVSIIGDTVVGRVEGATPSEVSKLVKHLVSSDPTANVESNMHEEDSDMLKDRLDKLINSSPVMLFMKGHPTQPRCGFSRQTVELLKSNEIPFASFDILTDDSVRAGLKTLYDWPTYPQLYIKGELIGGLDILKEMSETGNLKEQLGIADLKLPPPPSSIEDRLKELINLDTVTAFIKGTPSTPKCGFSRSLVTLLQQECVPFTHFDILSDEEVRQSLKKFSDWPTYPQVYLKGELIGGLDIVQEMANSGNLKNQFGLE